MEMNLSALADLMLDKMAQKRDELEHHGSLGVMFGPKDGIDRLRAGEKMPVRFYPAFEVDSLSNGSSKDPDGAYSPSCFASMKLWQMVRTGKSSGPGDVIDGECEYLGGVVLEEEWGEYYVFFFFSGAPQETDVAISQVGMFALPGFKEWEASRTTFR